jgi:Asp-tRNA(Asn)/Glu-tRNA(Gln) amidotransferase A subunit family amidase
VGVAAPGGSVGGAEAYAYHEQYMTSDRGGYQPQTLCIFERGAQTKASDYIRMWRQLQLIRRTVDDVFQNVDLLITPTRRHTARTVDAEINVLALAHLYERATEWHKRVPPLNAESNVPPLALTDENN